MQRTEDSWTVTEALKWPFGIAYLFVAGIWHLLRGTGDRV